MSQRAWQPPGRHWPDRPAVVAGLDETAGGSWLGLNDHGLVAAILNRRGSLGPQPGKRSRGELVLEALDHADAETAATALSELNPDAYRSFNLVLADPWSGYWLRHRGQADVPGIESFALPEGLSMLTARDLNDAESPRIAANLPRFRAAAAPDPESGDWRAWQDLLSSGPTTSAEDPFAGMTVITDQGFETVSSSLIALPAPRADLTSEPRKAVWLFAAGRPDRSEYQPLEL